MPVYPEPKLISQHSTYWLPSGDLHILVENVILVHHYFFKQDFFMFMGFLNNADDTSLHPSRKTLATTIILHDTSPEAYANFLCVFYNPSYSIYDINSWAK